MASLQICELIEKTSGHFINNCVENFKILLKGRFQKQKYGIVHRLTVITGAVDEMVMWNEFLVSLSIYKQDAVFKAPTDRF